VKKRMAKYRVLAAAKGYYKTGFGSMGHRRAEYDTIKASSASEAIAKAKKEESGFRKRHLSMPMAHGWKAIKVSTRKRTGWNWI
jgi:hypothetical protein